MFTGIISDIGEIIDVTENDSRAVKISCSYPLDDIYIGSSIACSGVCLTVVDKGYEDNNNFFLVDISKETDDKSTTKYWKIGSRINLEKSLKIGEELGGHFVYGHVDCIAKIHDIEKGKNSNTFIIDYPKDFKKFIARKGSVSLDGISLTVNEFFGADETMFTVNIIPHTKKFTTWSDIAINSEINLEVDPLSRYLANYKDIY
jgi:riboflavin synthase